MVSSLVVMAAAALLQQPACEPLKTLSLPAATITAVEFVAAGAQVPGRGGRGGAAAPLPAHCRVAVTLQPGHSIRGRVVDENGSPAKGAHIYPRSGAYPLTAAQIVRITADDTFDIKFLAKFK